MRELIGKGMFTKAYKVAEDKVEVISTCMAKEAYALFSQGNPFAPVIERNYAKDNAYFMPFYPKMEAPTRQLNKDGLRVYRILRKFGLGLDYFGFCKAVERTETLTEGEKEALIDLAGAVGNAISPEDMRFEISPRNVTYDEDGALILLDCFFSAKLAYKIAIKC